MRVQKNNRLLIKRMNEGGDLKSSPFCLRLKSAKQKNNINHFIFTKKVEVSCRHSIVLIYISF